MQNHHRFTCIDLTHLSEITLTPAISGKLRLSSLLTGLIIIPSVFIAVLLGLYCVSNRDI